MKYEFEYYFDSEFYMTGVCKIQWMILFRGWRNTYELRRNAGDYYSYKHLMQCIEEQMNKIESLKKFVEI